jgi:hypothetical protein
MMNHMVGKSVDTSYSDHAIPQLRGDITLQYHGTVSVWVWHSQTTVIRNGLRLKFVEIEDTWTGWRSRAETNLKSSNRTERVGRGCKMKSARTNRNANSNRHV